MVVIFPIFKHFGNFPSMKLLLIMVFRGSAMQLLISLVSLQEMLSNPDESLDGICCYLSVVVFPSVKFQIMRIDTIFLLLAVL